MEYKIVAKRHLNETDQFLPTASERTFSVVADTSLEALKFLRTVTAGRYSEYYILNEEEVLVLHNEM